MKARPHLVAVAARTPVGATAAASAAAVRASICQLAAHPFLVDREAVPVCVARDALLDPRLPVHERCAEMAVSVLEELAAQLQGVERELVDVPLLLALPAPRPGWSNEASRTVLRGLARLPLRFQTASPMALAAGHAGSFMALAEACQRIAQGRSEVCFVLAVDSYLDADTLAWLDDGRRLATSRHRSAFFPGEGAAAFAVVSEAWLKRTGIASLGEVRGVGVAEEPNIQGSGVVCVGTGLTQCLHSALASLRVQEESIDGVICTINGERYRSQEWGFALIRLGTTLADPTGHAVPASCWGDLGAASGAAFVALAAAGASRGVLRGPRQLLWAGSDDGQRAAAFFQMPARD